MRTAGICFMLIGIINGFIISTMSKISSSTNLSDIKSLQDSYEFAGVLQVILFIIAGISLIRGGNKLDDTRDRLGM